MLNGLHKLPAPYYSRVMETQLLLNIVLALAANEVVHALAEVTSARGKVARLSAYINKRSYKEMKLKIDSRLKSYTVSLAMFLVITSIFFAFFLWLDLTTETALATTAVLLVFAYAVLAVGLDQYHVDIEKVTKPFIKTKD